MMRKKVLYWMLLVLISISLLLAGCQDTTNGPDKTDTPKKTQAPATPPDDSLESVELVWYSVVDVVRPDMDMVWTEINNYLSEKINATVKYNFFELGDYGDKIKTAVTAGQYMDIMFTASNFDFVIDAQRDAFHPIEDLIPEYAPKTYELVPDGAWDAVTVNQHIYGVPSYKDMGDRFSFLCNKTMTDKYDLDFPQDGEWATMQDMLPFLYEAKAARDEDEPDLAQFPIVGMINGLKRFYPFEPLAPMVGANIPSAEAFKGKGSGEIAFNLYETDEYRAMCKLLKELVDDGIFPSDYANFDPDRALLNAGKLAGNFAGGYIEIKPDMYTGRETVLTNSSLCVMTTGYVQSAIQALSHQTKHPERAMMFLELINTDKELATMVRFGLEGEHYLINDEDRLDITISPRNGNIVSYSDFAYYFWYGWQFGNILAGELPSVVSTEFPNLLKALNDSSIQDTNLGFVVDTSNISNEIAACSSVIAEYDSSTNLLSGMQEDIDATVDDFIAKLESNGSKKIVEEVQEQLTNWRSTVGKPTK
ncbi:MAG TPA: hypothetical protein DIW17_05360 [Clostridiales bacterium]|nr:hypothetical protein [Clostridiales bacterium]